MLKSDVRYRFVIDMASLKGSLISKKSLATFITRIIDSPENYLRKNLGINKPNS